VPSVKVEDVISSILHGGLDRDRGWPMSWEKPTDPERLLRKVDLSKDDTRPHGSAQVGICTCGDESSAAFYAWDPNLYRENDTPVLIEFEADEPVIAIDGRDFLYTAFQFGNCRKTSDALRKLFGPNILFYAQPAWDSMDHDKRIALCDLAIYDRDVIQYYYQNKLVIAGRLSTKFRNSFKIRLPIGPSSIIRVWIPTAFSELPPADVNLSDIIDQPS